MPRSSLFFSSPLLLLLACGGSNVAVAVVDVDLAARESLLGKRVIRNVEAYAHEADAKLNQAAAEVEAEASDPDRSRADFQAMNAQLMEMRRQAQESVNQRRDKAESDVHLSLEEAVEALAKENGWKIVIRKGLHSAIWTDGALDKTEEVIRRMDSLDQASPTSDGKA